MPAGFPLEPRDVPTVETPYRRIATQIPVPESIETLQKLRQHEPRSMSGQPPILWDRAEGVQVHDPWGNTWLDFSSGVLVTNAGHSHPKIRQAVVDQAEHGLLHHYCFPSQARAEFVEALTAAAPDPLNKAFLLTTGSEATECAIKLMRTYGKSVGGDRKIGIVGYVNGFHGRTMGAQMAGGVEPQKEWIVNVDPAMAQVPFPDGFRKPDTGFDAFLAALDQQGMEPADVAGVIVETYQGGSAAFAPTDYIQKLRQWCDQHNVVLCFDEIQAGFGRTGRMWGFEHYDVVPDLFCMGKGMSSSLPISGVLGRADLMDQFPPGSMTSTHSGNPVCVAAAHANLKAVQEEGLIEHSRAMGEMLEPELNRMQERFGGPIGAADAKGLVGSLQFVKPGTTDADKNLATDIVRRCVEKGLMMFAPVGVGGGTIKINPPLTIPEDALREGLGVLEEAIEQALAADRETVSG
jgi:4-aminobutyrate aminotransferase-like enzyme